MDRQSLDEQMRGLLRLIAQTQREIELVEALGSEENYAIGTVICFEKEFDGTPGRMYSYAAIKYAGRWGAPLWAVTGMSGHRALSWSALVALITDKASTVRVSIAFPTQFAALWPIERAQNVAGTTEQFANEAIEAIRSTGVTAAQFADAVRANVIRMTGDNLVADVARDAATEALGVHASPHCACGVNEVGQRYVDPICRTQDDPEPFLPSEALRDMTLNEREDFARKWREWRDTQEHMTQPKPGDDV